jgi:hypothetical protein
LENWLSKNNFTLTLRNVFSYLRIEIDKEKI